MVLEVASGTIIVSRPKALDRTDEVAAGEAAAEQGSNEVGWRGTVHRHGIERRAIARHDLGDWIAWNIEEQPVASQARLPEPRQKLGALDGARVQQPVPARRIRGDRERVARRVRELHNGMLLH